MRHKTNYALVLLALLMIITSGCVRSHPKLMVLEKDENVKHMDVGTTHARDVMPKLGICKGLFN